MSASLNAFGLRPVRHKSGRAVARAVANGIASGYAVDLYRFTPVAFDTNGQLVIAANGSDFVGSFAGVEYTDSNGRRQHSNHWPANLAATEIVAYVYDDPDTIYEIQAEGSVAQSGVGAHADFSVAAGNAVGDGDDISQQSRAAVSDTLVAAAAQGMLRILGKSNDPANDWGDDFTVLEVTVARHQFVASKVAI